MGRAFWQAIDSQQAGELGGRLWLRKAMAKFPEDPDDDPIDTHAMNAGISVPWIVLRAEGNIEDVASALEVVDREGWPKGQSFLSFSPGRIFNGGKFFLAASVFPAFPLSIFKPFGKNNNFHQRLPHTTGAMPHRKDILLPAARSIRKILILGPLEAVACSQAQVRS